MSSFRCARGSFCTSLTKQKKPAPVKYKSDLQPHQSRLHELRPQFRGRAGPALPRFLERADLHRDHATGVQRVRPRHLGEGRGAVQRPREVMHADEEELESEQFGFTESGLID